MEIIDFEEYYAIKDGREARRIFDETLYQRLIDVGSMCLKEIKNKGFTFASIADSFSVSISTLSRFALRGVQFRPDELEAAFPKLIFPGKGIDEVLFGKPHAMALPTLADYFLSCTAEMGKPEKKKLEVFLRSLPSKYETPTDRCKALLSDRRKQVPTRAPFQFQDVLRRFTLIKRNEFEIDSNLKNAIKISLYLDCSMDYLSTQKCEYVAFYRQEDSSKTPISKEEQYYLSLFFPLSNESKMLACTKAGSLALKRIKKIRDRGMKKQDREAEEARSTEQDTNEPGNELANELTEQLTDESIDQAGEHLVFPDDLNQNRLLEFCRTPRTRKQIIKFMNIPSEQYALKLYLNPLFEAGLLQPTLPENPHISGQTYVYVEEDESQYANKLPEELIELNKKGFLEFCHTPRTRKEICGFLGLSTEYYVQKHYLDPLLAAGALRRTIPDKPQSHKQKYVAGNIVVDSFANEAANMDNKGMLEYCRTPRSRDEIIKFLNIPSDKYAIRRYFYPLVQLGAIRPTIPEHPHDPDQKYVTIIKE